MFRSSPLIASTGLLLLATGCTKLLGGTDSASSSAATTATAPAAAAQNSFAQLPRDPAIMALAASALKCRFENGDFEYGCEAFIAFRDNEVLFKEQKGDKTIVSMLADADEKVRRLASTHRLESAPVFFADAANTKQLFAMLKKESNSENAKYLAKVAASIQVTNVGVVAEFVEATKDPRPSVREELVQIVFKDTSPQIVAALNTLADDADLEVQRVVFEETMRAGNAGDNLGLCAIAMKATARKDSSSERALEYAGINNCPGVREAALKELERRVGNPETPTPKVFWSYVDGVGEFCGANNPKNTADIRARAFAMAQQLLDQKEKPVIRTHATKLIAACTDPANAKRILEKLTKDANKDVAKRSREKLDEMKKQ